MVTTAQISHRLNKFASRLVLLRAQPYNCLGKFGLNEVLPRKESKTIQFDRYESLPPAIVPVVEGVTPPAGTMVRTPITLVLEQLGYWIPISDVVEDTVDEKVVAKAAELMGEQAGESLDLERAGKLVAGTTIYYANGAARNAVNTVITGALLSRVQRFMENQKARKLTKLVEGGSKIATIPVSPAYWVVAHTDLLYDLERITGWIPVKDYASQKDTDPGEVGAYKTFRFVLTSNLACWTDAGGALGTMKSLTGATADVYPVLVFGEQAYATVGLATENAIQTFINPPGGAADPMHQKHSAAWKAMVGTLILNDNFMARIECAVTAEASMA